MLDRCQWQLGEDATISNVEGHVLEAKRGIIGSGSRVFAGSAQEEERNAEHVNDGKGFGCAVLSCDVGSTGLTRSGGGFALA